MHRFVICDVFTDRRFGGNPLAVLPDARGLDDGQMQRIAREFGFSETTFVLPPEQGHTRRVRIFTPRSEIPFAGHPNLGTAWVLAHEGLLGEGTEARNIVFEEAAGLVSISVAVGAAGPGRCELAAPQALEVRESVDVALAAAAIGLPPDEVDTATHPPRVASVGLPFLFVAVRSRDALERARPHIAGCEALEAAGLARDVHVYTAGDAASGGSGSPRGDGFDLRARVFAPLAGIPEDPATGSANCTLAALLAHCDPAPDLERSWKIAQGFEMGRPSTLYASAVKRDGEIVEARIAGESVFVAEGRIDA